MIIAAGSPAEQDPAYDQLGFLKKVATVPPACLWADGEEMLGTEKADAFAIDATCEPFALASGLDKMSLNLAMTDPKPDARPVLSRGSSSGTLLMPDVSAFGSQRA